MADVETIIWKLIDLDKSRRHFILKKAWDDYMEYIFDIANDIYGSCISHYYATYTPRVYTRHGRDTMLSSVTRLHAGLSAHATFNVNP